MLIVFIMTDKPVRNEKSFSVFFPSRNENGIKVLSLYGEVISKNWGKWIIGDFFYSKLFPKCLFYLVSKNSMNTKFFLTYRMFWQHFSFLLAAQLTNTLKLLFLSSVWRLISFFSWKVRGEQLPSKAQCVCCKAEKENICKLSLFLIIIQKDRTTILRPRVNIWRNFSGVKLLNTWLELLYEQLSSRIFHHIFWAEMMP